MKNEPIALEHWSKKFTRSQKQKAKVDNNYYEVIKEFKEARKNLGLTQQELANKAGIDRTVIAKIETGARNTTLNSLMMLAEAMDKKLKISII